MMSEPVVSYIVPSYNYADYIGQTIDSLLKQTFTDIEVVVIDDCSTDHSREVIRSFRDPRLRVIENERNLGGSLSFNRALEAARGRFIGNLDSDDWASPERTSLQLDVVASDPRIQVVGTWVDIVDANGRRHAMADAIEASTNQDHDFNLVDTWNFKNLLCRSSTLVDRRFHERFGTFEPGMVRAPDYELWTRPLGTDVRYGLVPEKLTHYRLHARGVTNADPLGTLLEFAYLIGKNVIPVLHERALLPSLGPILDWHMGHPEFARLLPRQRSRLLGMLAQAARFPDFLAFKAWLLSDEPDPAVEQVGNTVHILMTFSPAADRVDVLEDRLLEFERAKTDWFLPRIKSLEDTLAEYERLKAEWFLPRIKSLEDTLAEYERIKTEWFIPRIASLEKSTEQYETDKRDWFLPKIETLEREIALRDAKQKNYYEPKIRELERALAQRNRPDGHAG
jgi:glycosyltransferase involved in cell wall biosynthesis